MKRFAIPCALVLMGASTFAQAPFDSAAQAEVLAALREYASKYTNGLPNFTATQLIRRTMTPARLLTRPLMNRQPQTDSIEEQLSFVDRREVHTVTKIGGKPVSASDASQPSGIFSQGEFGNLLDVLFNPATQADFQWDRFATRNGRRMYVFSFRVPQPTGYAIMEPDRTIRVPYRGSIYADYESKAVMRIEMSCTDIPGSSDYRGLSLTLDYARTQVSGQEFILPSRKRLDVRTVAGDTTHDAEFRSYRRFGSEATILFDADPEE